MLHISEHMYDNPLDTEVCKKQDLTPCIMAGKGG